MSEITAQHVTLNGQLWTLQDNQIRCDGVLVQHVLTERPLLELVRAAGDFDAEEGLLRFYDRREERRRKARREKEFA